MQFERCSQIMMSLLHRKSIQSNIFLRYLTKTTRIFTPIDAILKGGRSRYLMMSSMRIFTCQSESSYKKLNFYRWNQVENSFCRLCFDCCMIRDRIKTIKLIFKNQTVKNSIAMAGNIFIQIKKRVKYKFVFPRYSAH